MFEAETKQLRQLAAAALADLDAVIGWGQGYDGLHTTPVFVTKPEDVDQLVWSPLCVHNLSGYLAKSPALQAKDSPKKIGICVKGCDSRSLVALIQEQFLSRDKLYIIGVPCSGTLDWRKIMKKLPALGDVRSVRVEGPVVKIADAQGAFDLPLEDVLARRCRRCMYPNPVVSDVTVGKEVAPRATHDTAYGRVVELDSRSVEERLGFWQEELDRCIRCYACRNACPLCVCQDKCIAETRDPKWLTQKMGTSEKFMFHMIHAVHLAGRCTECGECERVCPMEIPVTLMKEKLNKITKDLLDYEAGIDMSAVPPLLTYKPGEHEL